MSESDNQQPVNPSDRLRDRIAAVLLESWDERQRQNRACWPDPRSLHCQDCANADADAVIAELGLKIELWKRTDDPRLPFPFFHPVTRYFTDWKADDYPLMTIQSEREELNKLPQRSIVRSDLISSVRGWFTTWRVWRLADPEQRAILTGPINPRDYVDAPRPEGNDE